MKNSAIKEVFSTVYAENSIEKMLAGKCYSRCMRANDVVSTILKKMVIEQVDDADLKGSVLNSYETLIESDKLINYDILIDNITRLQEKISGIEEELSESETNSLWLTYLEMVDILNCNVMAERSSNWELYLTSLQNMLPFFAGSGRNNYTKSIYWFLQEMANLSADVLEEFKKGLLLGEQTRFGRVFPLISALSRR